MFDPQVIAQDFPILQRPVAGKRLIYLDSGATSQKPQVVLDAIMQYYQTSNANVHRGVHTLSDHSTQAWEESRAVIAQFLGADSEELIITRNTTEALNGVIWGWAEQVIEAGDVVVTTLMEHHANLVPWQELCHRKGAHLEFIGVDATGRLDVTDLEKFIIQYGSKIKVVALTHVSNVLGTLNPLEQVVQLLASSYSFATRPKIVIDGAQSAPHIPIDFRKLNIDFFAFSGHKMLGPMGVGGLLVRKELLEKNIMKPWLFGGGMISSVTTTHTEFAQRNAERFTAGTPDVASIVGLAAACKYLEKIGMKNVATHDAALVSYALKELAKIPQVKLVGPTQPKQDSQELDRVGTVTFIYAGVHAHDVAQILDSEGVAVRSGHHCTMPLHQAQGWQATVRMSFNVYTSQQDIAAAIFALEKVKQVFQN